jgi:hypothetical protein
VVGHYEDVEVVGFGMSCRRGCERQNIVRLEPTL